MAHKDTSRRDAAYGKNMMKRFNNINIALFGLRGVGVEAAKNLLLTGPASLTICDEEIVTVEDLGCNFYLHECDVGKVTRAKGCFTELHSINPSSTLSIHTGAVDEAFLLRFKGGAVVFTDARPLANLVKYNQFCRSNNIAFFTVGMNGLFASVFSDLGDDHAIVDTNGSPTWTMPVKKICLASDIIDAMQQQVDSLSADILQGLQPNPKRRGKTKATAEKIKSLVLQVDMLSTQLYFHRKGGLNETGQTRVAIIVDFNPIERPRHRLFTGDKVNISGVTGMAAMNTSKLKGPKSVYFEGGKDGTVFFVDRFPGDTTPYTGSGAITTTNPSKTVHHVPLAKTLGDNPHIDPNLEDFFKFGRSSSLHIARKAMWRFSSSHAGALPRLHNADDAKDFLAAAKAEGLVDESEDAAALMTKVALYARTETVGMCAYIGGVVAQEVMKKTGYHTPLEQWFHFDYLELCPLVPPARPASSSRYGHQISLFGEAFQEKMASQHIFMVGCGALGCEYLKGLALIGAGVGPKGAVHITDDDVIELSNLSRQFLFRERHVKTLKAKSAAESVCVMNPDFASAVKVITERVEPATETVFVDSFWDSLDFVLNALDNMKARYYVDSKCTLHSLPLFEAGTLATEANTSVHIPNKTPHYGAGALASTKGIPKCTLTSFPYLADHCIEWAKDRFTSIFEGGTSNAADFLADKKGFLESVENADKANQPVMLRQALDFARHAAAIAAMGDKQQKLQYLLQVSAKMYSDYFDKEICDLIALYPKDMGLPGGKPNVDEESGNDLGAFWTGRRKFPQPLSSRSDTRFVDFCWHTICIFGDALSVFCHSTSDAFDGYPTRKQVEAAISAAAASGAGAAAGKDSQELEPLKKEAVEFQGGKALAGVVSSVEFEKDEPLNHHIEWLTAVTNARSTNYEIKESDLSTVRVKAGNILAAIATATAGITGLQIMEIYKHVLGVDAGQYRQTTFNLATNRTAVEGLPDLWPEKDGVDKQKPPRPYMVVPTAGWTVWDTIDINEGDMTGPEVQAWLQKNYEGVRVTEIVAKGYDTALWAAGGGGGDARLGETFLALRASGKGCSGRSKLQRDRAGKELKAIKKAMAGNLSFVTAVETGDDIYHLRLKMQGPDGSVLEGGTFVVDVRLKKSWPDEQPGVSISPTPYHVNFKDGKPCEMKLFSSSWSQTTSIAAVLQQLHALLRDQDLSVPLRPDMALQYTNDRAAFDAAARAHTKQRAVDRPLPSASDGATKEAAVPVSAWPHDYILLECEAEHPDYASPVQTNDKISYKSLVPMAVHLPRIRFHFRGKPQEQAPPVLPPARSASGSMAFFELDEATTKAAMALKLEIEGEPLTPTGCYRLQPSRAARYAKIKDVEGLTAENGIAITCDGPDGEVVETLVVQAADGSMTQIIYEDAISWAEISIPSMVEASFSEDGPWIMTKAAGNMIEACRASQFKMWEKIANGHPGGCCAGLRRMLQQGPVSRLYAEGDKRVIVMPEEELADWQAEMKKNGKMVTTDIPRPVFALRVWHAEKRRYESVDTLLAGAPANEEKAREWYQAWIMRLKSHIALTPAWVDGMATSTRHKTHTDIQKGVGGIEPDDIGAVTNAWTKLCIDTKPSSKSEK